jgi:DNA-binding MarR family transcriptional regulator
MGLTQEQTSCSKVPAVLREGLSWPIARIAHAFALALNETLAPLQLNMRTYAVLAMVSGGAARKQLEIAQGVGLDKTTLVAALDDLERRALVSRKPDPDDRRARIVSITCEGEKLLAEAAGHVRATERRMLAHMVDEEAEQTKAAMIALLRGPLLTYFDRAGSCL